MRVFSGDLTPPIAIVLAGGRGSRLGGDKALAPLGERPLITYPIAAARAAGLEVVVVAKRGTALPELAGRVLYEPDEPRHPLCGVVAGLREFATVLAIPCDMPLLTPALLFALAEIDGPAAVPEFNGTLAPFPSLYRRSTLPVLLQALKEDASMRQTLARLEPVGIPLPDARQLFSVNTPGDLAAAGLQLTAG